MSETILIAEDEPQVFELMKVILESKNYHVHWAGDGEEALRKARLLKPDLLLMDIMMPKMNGYEVLHLLKENQELKDIPVIFVSVKSETDDKVVGLRMGGQDYISKPFDIYELVARVEAVLRIKNDSLPMQRRPNRRVSELALADPLTGLFSRRYALERLQEELLRAARYQYPVACLLLKIDDFEKLGASLGRLESDKILQRLALLIKKSNRVVDLTARFGPEEFLVLLTQTDLTGGGAVGERFRKLVNRAHLAGREHPRKVTISIGVGAYASDRTGTPEELILQAERSLKLAEERGKNCLVAAGVG